MANGAELFHQLHFGSHLFKLTNCWDAGSACVLQSLDVPAVATTSAGLAWSNGYADGNVLPTDKLIQSVAAIMRVLRIPLSVDLEGGYSSDANAVGETVAALIDLGVAGINLEDGGEPPNLLENKIRTVARIASGMGVELFINARTDVYLKQLVPEAQRVNETLERAQRYANAGASGLFVPKLISKHEIQKIAAECLLPLNLLAVPGLASTAQLPGSASPHSFELENPDATLFKLGVKRLSSGSALAQLASHVLRQSAQGFLSGDPIENLHTQSWNYAELNALFKSQ
jgi:2-methylisocitrate lyase-like PEP mutase family enzyme